MTEPPFIPVAQLTDLTLDSPLGVKLNGTTILLCLSGADVFAIAERCTHAEQSLCTGRIRNGWIACPAHGARFDLETGEALNPPATEPIHTFPARIVDGVVEVAA